MSGAAITGGCTCGAIRYALRTPPMVVHCCHCRWCQRETGSAFAVNAMIEADRLEVTQGEPEMVMTPSNSGKGQEIARCPACRVALWSHYAGSRRQTAFVRVGTMDDPTCCPPHVHIFASSKQPWVVLPEDAKVFADYYPGSEGVWPEEGRRRWKVLKERA